MHAKEKLGSLEDVRKPGSILRPHQPKYHELLVLQGDFYCEKKHATQVIPAHPTVRS